MNDNNKGYLYVFISSIMWGTIPLFTKYLYQVGTAPLTVASFRCYFASIMAFIYFVVTKKYRLYRNRHYLFYIAYGALAISATFICYALALKSLTSAMASVLLYTAPAFVNILEAIIYKNRLTKTKILSVIIAFLGTAMVVNLFDGNSMKGNGPGILFGLLSGFFYSLTTVIGTKAKQYNDGSVNGLIIMMTGSLPFLPISPPWKIAELEMIQILYLLGLSLISTALPYCIYLTAVSRKIDSGYASILATFELIVATMLGVIVFNDELMPIQMVGIIVVLIGVTLPFWVMNRREKIDEKRLEEIYR